MPTPDGWGWLALLGVERTHPAAGCRFMEFDGGLSIAHVHYESENALLSQKWWFALECKRGREDLACEELGHAADRLNAMAELDLAG